MRLPSIPLACLPPALRLLFACFRPYFVLSVRARGCDPAPRPWAPRQGPRLRLRPGAWESGPQDPGCETGFQSARNKDCRMAPRAWLERLLFFLPPRALLILRFCGSPSFFLSPSSQSLPSSARLRFFYLPLPLFPPVLLSVFSPANLTRSDRRFFSAARVGGRVGANAQADGISPKRTN